MVGKAVPEVVLNSGHSMPMLGFGTAGVPLPPLDELVPVFVVAIEAGYRHFDTATLYGSEEALGLALAQAQRQGLIKNRGEIFVTTKLWCSDSHPDLVLLALKKSLQRLGLDYVDLYLIHYPVRLRQGIGGSISKGDVLPFDIKGTWEAMEECSKLGLTKSIGVSNFGAKSFQNFCRMQLLPLLLIRTCYCLQIEMNVAWQQGNLRKFCQEKGIHVSAWSPLGANGASWGSLAVIDSPVLKDIAIATGKSVAQIALRWIFEQGVTPVVKSFNKVRMNENLQIFDWNLS
ncbi:NAD(P)H-dependent 6'-deoxychalcone synthase [Glycine soja]|nr:NAD(P)H-dependent 6'-deoxychalcone synthase [Glycine soja]